MKNVVYENDIIYKIKGTNIHITKIIEDFKRKYNIPQDVFCDMYSTEPVVVMVFGKEKVIFMDNEYYIVAYEIKCGDEVEYITPKEPLNQDKIYEIFDFWRGEIAYKIEFAKIDDFYYRLEDNKLTKCTEEYWKSVPEELRKWIIA